MLSCIGGSESESDSNKFKKPELSASEVSEIKKLIHQNKDKLKEISRAEKLDEFKSENSFKESRNNAIDKIKKEFPEFFDEESGNSVEEGLNQVKDEIMDEIHGLNTTLKDIKAKFIDLNSIITVKNKDKDQSLSNKRQKSEDDIENISSASKKLRNDDGKPDYNSCSDSSTPDSDPCSSTSYKTRDTSNDSPPLARDNEFFGFKSEVQFLDILMKLIKAILGDDDLN